jgi:MFS family permease
VSKLVILFVTAFVDMVGLTMIVPLLPYYATDFGADAATVGLLISAFSVAQLAVSPVWGRVSDRYGRRPAILAGLLITASAYVLFAFAGSVPALLMARLVQGVGGGTIGVVQAYVADVSSPEQRTKSLGWLSAITSLGAVAGPAVGSLLVSLGGLEFVGLGAAGIALLVALFAWGYLSESRRLPTTAEHSAGRTTGRAAIARVLSRWHEPAPRLIWIYAVGIGAFYGTIQIVPLLLADRLGVTERTVGYFVMYMGGMGVVVRALVLGRAVDALGEARLARHGPVGLGARGRVHPDAARDGVPLPLHHRPAFPDRPGARARALHGGAAHLRRRLPRRLPHCGGPADRPLRDRRPLLARGCPGAGHPPAHPLDRAPAGARAALRRGPADRLGRHHRRDAGSGGRAPRPASRSSRSPPVGRPPRSPTRVSTSRSLARVIPT